MTSHAGGSSRRGRVSAALAAGIAAWALAGCGTTPPEAHALGISVQGNHLVRTGRGTVRLIGVNRSGSEYSCTGDDSSGGHGYGVFQGPVSSRAIKPMRSWKVNAVAIPLNEACWLGGYGDLKPDFTGDPYRQAIVGYVSRLNRAGIFAVLRLSGAAPGNHAYGEVQSSSEIPMADADHSVEFWRSVASSFKDNPAVLFHTYDEPHHIDWPCLLKGCTAVSDADHGGAPDFGSYRTAGQQALVDAIRSQGAEQPIIVSGIDFAGNVSEWEQYKPNDPANALVVNLSSFDYGDAIAAQKGYIVDLAKRYPIVFGGFGDTDCNSDYSRKLMRFSDRVGVSYLAWTWNTTADYGGCRNALLEGLPAYYSGKPSGFGAGVRDHYRRVKHS